MRTILLLLFIYLIVRIVMNLLREGGQSRTGSRGFRFYRYSTGQPFGRKNVDPRRSRNGINRKHNLDSIEDAEYEELDDNEDKNKNS